MGRRKVLNKRILGVVLCLLIVAGTMPAYAFAEETSDLTADVTQEQSENNLRTDAQDTDIQGVGVDNDCITISSESLFQMATMDLVKTWDGTMEYSTDKINWTVWNGGYINSVEAADGKHYIYVRGDNNTYVSNGTTWALMKPDQSQGHTIDISGNIETLRGATGDQPSEIPMAENCYRGMFKRDQWLSSAPDLTATSLAESCYSGMFQECISLKQAPELPALTLAEGCYEYMFIGCNGLTTAPDLPATELAARCYAHMFDSCYYLKSAQNRLPADVLKANCYDSMFIDCIRLVDAPELPATNLAEYCYQGMFANCSELRKAPKLPATELADYCYFGMFTCCWELQKVPKLPAKQLTTGCYSEMFLGCQSLTAPADMSKVTVLAANCCYRMYENCINLGIYTEAQSGLSKEWKATSAAESVDGWSESMFTNTCGDFTDNPVEGTTYYIANRTPIAHTAIAEDTEGGYVSIHQKYYIAGKLVEAIAVPYDGYVVASFTARDKYGRDIPIVDGQFIMPDSDVTIIATFKSADEEGGGTTEPGESDTGVKTSDDNPLAAVVIIGILALCGAGFVYKRREN